MAKVIIKRSATAEWLTEDLHDTWERTTPMPFGECFVSLHTFLDYCRVLRLLKEEFESDDKMRRFDKCIFFLRGGYFAFAYLNLVTSMSPRAVICGGLNHGARPKLRLSKLIRDLRTRSVAKTQGSVRLLIVDEVKSGTGIGTALRLIRREMQSGPRGVRGDVNVVFYAIRPHTETYIGRKLRETVEKWAGRHRTSTGTLNVSVTHFSGALIGYDNGPMCGIKTRSSGRSKREAYELVKLNRGRIYFTCDDKPTNTVLSADINAACLVESLSYYAVTWTVRQSSAPTQQLITAVTAQSCTTCKVLLRKAVGLVRNNRSK